MAEISQLEIAKGVGMGNAGWRELMVADEPGAETFPVMVCYPTQEPECQRSLGPYTVSAAWDATPLPGEHPLVMLSHGSGSSPLVNRDLALTLARAGYVVGMPLHPGDNRDDRSLQDALQNLQQRPRHLQLAINAVLESSLFPGMKPHGIALIGHSLGAYTALALAGGQPRTLPEVWPDRPTEAIAVAHDPRVTALVLLAPAVIWFHAPGALDAVQVPVLMLAGDQDTVTPPPHHADLVARQLPRQDLLDYRTINGAGHFSFLSVFPPRMQQPAFAPAQDPPGFDRAAFQAQLAEDIMKFLRETTSIE
jgi:predicted dienelactone hydrolase